MEHDFDIRVDYPNHSPSGRLWVGHFYICDRCGFEVGHPDHMTPDNEKCPGSSDG